MAQYDVYPGNPGLGFIVDIQHDLLDHLPTRVMVPLLPVETGGRVQRLNPILTIEGKEHMLAANLVFTISGRELGKPVANISEDHLAISGAIDMLVSGI